MSSFCVLLGEKLIKFLWFDFLYVSVKNVCQLKKLLGRYMIVQMNVTVKSKSKCHWFTCSIFDLSIHQCLRFQSSSDTEITNVCILAWTTVTYITTRCLVSPVFLQRASSTLLHHTFLWCHCDFRRRFTRRDTPTLVIIAYKLLEKFQFIFCYPAVIELQKWNNSEKWKSVHVAWFWSICTRVMWWITPM